MKEITLIFDDCIWLNKELEEYISALKGVIAVNINDTEEEIYIKYNPNLISINILKLEILTFTSNHKIPSLIAFNKHSNKKLERTSIIIKDICCEYCFKSIIEELLLINGIDYAYSQYSKDYIATNNIVINITYDNEIITKQEIINLEIKLNTY